MKKIAVVGAGGFAREVKWLLEELENLEFAGFVVSDLEKLGNKDSKDEVLGDLDWLGANQSSIDGLAIGIGNPRARLDLGRKLAIDCPSLAWPALVHPSVKMDSASCRLARGTILCAGTIATVSVEVREFAMVNLACTLGHEAVLGPGCVLNPTVNISGGVVLGEGVLVGTGAQILQYVSVGDFATVGAGAMVNKPVDSGVTVVGVPAKALSGSR